MPLADGEQTHEASLLFSASWKPRGSSMLRWEHLTQQPNFTRCLQASPPWGALPAGSWVQAGLRGKELEQRLHVWVGCSELCGELLASKEQINHGWGREKGF